MSRNGHIKDQMCKPMQDYMDVPCGCWDRNTKPGATNYNDPGDSDQPAGGQPPPNQGGNDGSNAGGNSGGDNSNAGGNAGGGNNSGNDGIDTSGSKPSLGGHTGFEVPPKKPRIQDSKDDSIKLFVEHHPRGLDRRLRLKGSTTS